MKVFTARDIDDFIDRCIYVYMTINTQKRYWLPKKDIEFLKQFIIVYNVNPNNLGNACEIISSTLQEPLEKVKQYKRKLITKRWLSRDRDGYEIPPAFNFKDKGYEMSFNVKYEFENAPIRQSTA